MSSLRSTCSLFALAVMFVAGCSSTTDPKSSTGDAAKKTPLPQVTVAAATTQTIIDNREFTGHTAAVAAVEIRPRVSGYLLQTPRALEHQADGLPNPSHAVQSTPDAVSIMMR